MKHTTKRIISMFLLVCALTSLCSVFAIAAYNPPDDPESSAYLDSYGVGATAESGGFVAISVDVDAVVKTTIIGATDIYIYEGTSSTGIFTCVAHYAYEDNPLMVGTGYTYDKTPIRHPGTVGKYYYASVRVVAGDNTGEDARSVPTNTVVAHN